MTEIVYPLVLMSGIGVLAGVVLTIITRLMHVPVDERITAIRAELPGVNCGACGFAGCDEYAEKLVQEQVSSSLCIPGGEELAKKIAQLMGTEAEEVQPMCAVVHCSGTKSNTADRMEYHGIHTCLASSAFYNGKGSCGYGCIGFGDCVQVCPYNALHICNGVAVVDRELCTGCGLCTQHCPKNLITTVPKSAQVYVSCSSNDKGAAVRKACKVGCIGCGRCKKACEYGAITVENFLASINPDTCTNCGACVEVCPTKSIHSLIPNHTEQVS